MRYRVGWALATVGYVALGSWTGACSAVDGQTPTPSDTDDTQQDPTSSSEDTLPDSAEPSSDTTLDTTESTTEDEPAEELTLGTLGASCSVEQTQACAGNNQGVQLVCSDGKWARLGECNAEQRCDSRVSHAGECGPIVTACVGLTPGAAVASCSGNRRQVCGPDLITLDDAAACGAGEGCDSGSCEPTVPGCTSEADGWVCDANGTERVQCGPNGTEADRMECAGDDRCFDGVCGVPSCGGVAAACGPSQTGNCCERLLVSGGSYNRGTDEAFPATVADFTLDQYEVTVGRFRQFKAAWEAGTRPEEGAGVHVHLNEGLGLLGSQAEFEIGWRSDWESEVDVRDAARGSVDPLSTWTSEPGDHEELPINFVNWYEAFAFCIWDGGFLPSEAEWEYAAAGGAEPDGERTYPWGSAEPTCSEAVYDNCETSLGRVGSHSPQGDGRFGQSDLAGSVYEWTLDFDGEPYVTPCENCMTTTEASTRVIRGGYLDSSARDIQASSRSSSPSSNRSYAIGVRCAHAP